MSESDILHLVKSIPDGQQATITLTDLTGSKKHLQGVFKESIAPAFFFLCKGSELPDTLDTSRQCPFASQDRSGVDLAFIADIVEKTSSRALELVARKTVRAEDLRQFFRVTLRAPVIVRFSPQEPARQQEQWEMTGETVDLSQSGVLMVLPRECHNTSNLIIEIALTNPKKTVLCTSRLIRTRRVRKDRWLTSFHFDHISSADRDVIAKNCFSEQRRQLRDKGQTY